MTPAQWRALLAEIGKAALELHRHAVDLLAEMGTGEDSDDEREPEVDAARPADPL